MALANGFARRLARCYLTMSLHGLPFTFVVLLAAVPPLHAGASLEAQRRVEMLIGSPKSSALTPGEIRCIRAVQTLERIATPEARRLLHELAKGSEAASLTREAREALERLSGHRVR